MTVPVIERTRLIFPGGGGLISFHQSWSTSFLKKRVNENG